MRLAGISSPFQFAAVLFFGAMMNQEAMAQSSAVRNLAGTCASCHGVDGHAEHGMPSIAGRKAEELIALLLAFRADQRPATIMHQISKGYTDDQLRLIAEYFSNQAKGAAN